MRNAIALGLATNRAATLAALDVDERDTPCFDLQNAAADRAKVYVYGFIGGWKRDAATFVQAVHGITAKGIDLHVNSPGGLVYDAVAMHEALRAHPASVTTHIDGMAASAASFLALAGDEIEIARGGRVMIHDAAGVGVGDAAALREYADLLDAVSDDIAGYYADRAGGKPAAWRAAMQSTTWYSAQQAVDAGLADRVTGAESKTAAADVRSQTIRARARVALGGVQ